MFIDLYYDKTPTEHQAKFDQLFSLGYRIVSLSVYGDPLQARYAAVWLKQDGPPWVACHGKHAAEYQQFFDHWTAQDYRLRIVTATGAGQAAVFAAVFEKSSSAGWFAKHGLISGQDADQKTFQYQCKFAKSNSYRLTWAAAYGDSAHPLFAGVWERNNTAAGWEYRLGEADGALQNDLLSFGASGAGPDLITRSSDTNSYLSIWTTPAATEWWADFRCGSDPDTTPTILDVFSGTAGGILFGKQADVNLYRPSARVLQTDSALAIGAGTPITKVLSAIASLDFGSTNAEASSDLTMTLTGADVGDVVALGVPNASVIANSSYSAWVSAADTVTVRFSNHSADPVSPAGGSFRVAAIKF